MNDLNVYGGKPEVAAKEFKQLEAKKATEVRDKERIVRVYARRRDMWVSQAPELEHITTEAEFLALQERKRLPILAWEDCKKYRELEQELRELKEQPLPKIKKGKHEEQAAHGTARPRYMDHDQRYQELLAGNELIRELRQKYSDLDNISSITQDPEDGSVRLNRELINEFNKREQMTMDTFAIEEATRVQFRKQLTEEDPALLKQYDENEEHRIYKSPEADPAFVRMNRLIDKETAEAIQQKVAVVWELPQPHELTVNKHQLRERISRKHHLQFARAHRAKAAGYAQKVLGLQQALAQLKQEELQHATQGVYAGIVGRRTEEPSVVLPPVAPTSDQAEMPSPSMYRREMPRSTPPPTNLQPRQPGGGSGEPGGDAGRPDPRPPRSPGRALKPPVPTAHQAVGLIKRASWFVPPKLYILIGIIILLLFLLLIILLGGGLEVDGPEGAVPVNISKSVDKTEVDNPPNTEDITYTIEVSYPGTATDIIVTDPIPDGATFVRAEPPAKLFDAAGVETTDVAKVAKVEWSVREIQHGTLSPSPQASSSTTLPDSSFDQAVFRAEGFPAPQNPNPVELDPEALGWWQSYFMPHAVTAAEKLGIDVGYIGFWSFFEGINYNLTFNNCDNAPDRWDPNKPCSSRNVQVGPGIRPYDLPVSALQEAFEQMYGSSDNAIVQQVGQQIIENMQARHNVRITYPASTFPNISLQEIMNANTAEEKHWFEHLVKDDRISMYYLARTFKGHLDASVLADTMECCWGDATHYARQRTINYIKAIYDAGLTGGDGGGNRFSPQTLTLVVQPKSDTQNSYIINQASARVIGGSSGSSPSISQPLDLAGLEKKLLPPPNDPRCQNTDTGTCGRSLEKVRPYKIVMHTTHGATSAEQTYDYFASGAGGRGVGSHFAVGQDGKILQMVELYEDSVEYAQAVGNYQNHISIEMGSSASNGNYSSKDAMSPEQFDASKRLALALMQKYNIPKGNIEWDVTVDQQRIDDQAQGIFGHYQLNTNWAGDPGSGWFRDFRAEL